MRRWSLDSLPGLCQESKIPHTWGKLDSNYRGLDEEEGVNV